MTNSINVSLEAQACLKKSETISFGPSKTGKTALMNAAVKKCGPEFVAVKWVLDSSDLIESNDIQDHIYIIKSFMNDNLLLLQKMRLESSALLSMRIYCDFDEVVVSFSLDKEIVGILDRVDVSVI